MILVKTINEEEDYEKVSFIKTNLSSRSLWMPKILMYLLLLMLLLLPARLWSRSPEVSSAATGAARLRASSHWSS